MIQDGYYKCRATGSFDESDLGYSGAQNSTAGVAVECEILASDGASLGKMRTYLYFTPNSAELGAKRLRALGLVGNDVSTGFPGLGSVIADCEIKTETYEGKSRQKLEIKTGGGAAFKAPMDAPSRRKFAATLGRFLSSVPAVEGATADSPETDPADIF